MARLQHGSEVRASQDLAPAGLCDSHAYVSFTFLRDVRGRVWRPASHWPGEPGYVSPCHLLHGWCDGRIAVRLWRGRCHGARLRLVAGEACQPHATAGLPGGQDLHEHHLQRDYRDLAAYSRNVVRWRAYIYHRVSQTLGHHDCRRDSLLRPGAGNWLLRRAECSAGRGQRPVPAHVILLRPVAAFTIIAQVSATRCALPACIPSGPAWPKAGWLW